MAEPFVGEIRMFGGNFAPAHWAFCNGQLVSVAENQALFSLMGNRYGGDGRTNFALPDLRGRVPVHKGAGPGLTPYNLGERAGEEREQLNVGNLPQHTHALMGSTGGATTGHPTGGFFAVAVQDSFTASAPDADLNENAIRSAGGSQPHDNTMPFLCVNFIIALDGIYPPRS